MKEIGQHSYVSIGAAAVSRRRRIAWRLRTLVGWVAGWNSWDGRTRYVRVGDQLRALQECGARSWQLDGHAICRQADGHEGRHVWEVQ